ncbi:J domain-containing protein [Mariniflexile jejuense]|uniref:J domain-containing protein n=1 Tax=Mariniflexile jejuense TaxID=1173582 RepID=A0ABW3JKL8_9FLAO
MNDYYYVLGVSRNASQVEIKTAYRKLSKKFHPDLNGGDKFFEDRFKEIQIAYETLTDLSKKSRYDSLLNNNTYSKTQQSYSQNTYSKPPPRPESTAKKEYKNPEPKNTNSPSSSKIFAYLFLGFIGVLSISIFFDEKSKSSNNYNTIEQNEKPSTNFIPVEKTEIEKYSTSVSDLNKKWLKGELSGTIEQFDINEKWVMNLNVKKGRDIFGSEILSFKVDYPSLNCGGDWGIISQSDNKIEFREKIKYGNDVCIDSGKAVVEKKDNKIIISFYLPNNNTLYAQGILSNSKTKWVNGKLTSGNSDNNSSSLSSKNKYIGNQLQNGDSPLDKCFGKGIYSGQAYLIFKNSNATDAIVCLVRQSDKKTIRNEYIRAGADFKMSRIPSGNYFIKVYYGNDWNPQKLNFCNINGAFESNVHFSKSDNIGDMISIENSSYSYTTGSITLYTVANGNMSSENINESEFFQE